MVMRKQKTYLLKLWNDSSEPQNWRASLEDILTKDKQYFATMRDLSEELELLNDESEEMLESDVC